MNSLYGAMGNAGFRYFDARIAEGITLTGQFYLKSVMCAINKFITQISGIEKEHAYYGDTDSVYFEMAAIIDKFVLPKCKDENGDIILSKVIDSMDKIINDKITPAFNNKCDEVGIYTNSNKQLMNFKREALADTGFWCCHPSTLVETKTDGNVSLEELWDNYSSETDDARIRTCNIELRNIDTNGIEQFDVATSVYRKEYSGTLFEIEDEDGNVVMITPEHLVLVAGADGTTVWKMAKDLMVGDELICSS